MLKYIKIVEIIYGSKGRITFAYIHIYLLKLFPCKFSTYHQIIRNPTGGISSVPIAPSHIDYGKHHRCHHYYHYQISGKFLQWTPIGSNIHRYHPVIIRIHQFQRIIAPYQIGISFFAFHILVEILFKRKKKTNIFLYFRYFTLFFYW